VWHALCLSMRMQARTRTYLEEHTETGDAR
jgi:hypothetical protein